jgi:hypothetical protein
VRSSWRASLSFEGQGGPGLADGIESTLEQP